MKNNNYLFLEFIGIKIYFKYITLIFDEVLLFLQNF
jgi:hypothetical protein